jgi:hypothetical protein
VKEEESSVLEKSTLVPGEDLMGSEPQNSTLNIFGKKYRKMIETRVLLPKSRQTARIVKQDCLVRGMRVL